MSSQAFKQRCLQVTIKSAIRIYFFCVQRLSPSLEAAKGYEIRENFQAQCYELKHCRSVILLLCEELMVIFKDNLIQSFKFITATKKTSFLTHIEIQIYSVPVNFGVLQYSITLIKLLTLILLNITFLAFISVILLILFCVLSNSLVMGIDIVTWVIIVCALGVCVLACYLFTPRTIDEDEPKNFLLRFFGRISELWVYIIIWLTTLIRLEFLAECFFKLLRKINTQRF